MENYELYLPPKNNNGFQKGHIPHNKGKRAKEYMTEKSYKKMISNLQRNGNPNIGGWNKKSVIAFKNKKLYGIFESSQDAGKKLKLNSRNIRSVCAGKRKHCGGIEFFWEENEDKYLDYFEK